MIFRGMKIYPTKYISHFIRSAEISREIISTSICIFKFPTIYGSLYHSKLCYCLETPRRNCNSVDETANRLECLHVCLSPCIVTGNWICCFRILLRDLIVHVDYIGSDISSTVFPTKQCFSTDSWKQFL